jgi:hypothetical protein
MGGGGEGNVKIRWVIDMGTRTRMKNEETTREHGPISFLSTSISSAPKTISTLTPTSETPKGQLDRISSRHFASSVSTGSNMDVPGICRYLGTKNKKLEKWNNELIQE